MNWEAAGAIGEIVGALAVVVTLGYLALQMKQSLVGMKVAAKQEMTRQFSDYVDFLLAYPEATGIFRGSAVPANIPTLDGVRP